MKDHKQVVDKQFGEQANAYLTSAVHAQGEEFSLLQQAVANRQHADVLDLGCGAGHVSFNVAPSVNKVIAYDLSESMLEVVAASSAAQHLGNIETVQGVAESLPFADNSFDFVFSRYSAHHWQDLGIALREVIRVLKPSGVVAFIDVISPQQPLFDTYLQTVEVLRDTSHVRDYTVAEWIRQLGESGLIVTKHHRQKLRLEFTSWVERMRTPALYRDAILALQQSMAQEVRDYFAIDQQGSFTTDVLVVWATK
ncbi:class I SAM-dependent methyltransferase [Entomomonas asaccharolytica]|uniref:Methyltransferase domain-containing protein n=1 Tax=Entomomonas asaccharolytica TaxID=2785331 RepID=A0A974RVV1_9GAMM|nr:class I SAM-dependent methyltransferase [Entomomonas asaccharolytica]QQP84427.1 methyltransferase domain-containing protein [Entomomonas asaccharolytica]